MNLQTKYTCVASLGCALITLSSYTAMCEYVRRNVSDAKGRQEFAGGGGREGGALVCVCNRCVENWFGRSCY